jgi:hypothetical protein
MNDLTDRLDKPLPKIKITCTSVDCQNDLHCYLQKKRTGNNPSFGGCRSCGAENVDWERAHRRDPNNVTALFAELKTELIREHMWSKPFDDDAVRKFCKLSKEEFRVRIAKRLQSSVGRPANAWDSRQTPMEGNVVFYAQHATATCCRQCMLYWHGIDKSRELTTEEKDYFLFLIEKYLEERGVDELRKVV